MVTLSLCMIVKNEEDVIARLLNSVEDLFDEIIVVDTGSTDNTKQILNNFNCKIFDYKWHNDFASARNYAFSHATSDFIMWLDADDIIIPSELKKLKALKGELNNNIDVVMLKYSIGSSDNQLKYYRERILRKNMGFVWEDAVHECITPRGNIIYKDIFITHAKIKSGDPKRNLKIYNSLIKNKVKLSPRQMFYYARELMYNNNFKKAIIWFKRFLKTTGGFKENYIEACLNLSYCYLNTNNQEIAKQTLFKSFNYDLPRSEILCELGNIYYEQKLYNQSIYYYLLATTNTPNENNGGFINPDCYGFLPYLQISFSYYYLNNFSMANHYFNIAKKLKPNSTLILENQKFFN